MKVAMILLMLILMSCTPSIKDEFHNTIIAYQKEFKIPIDANESDTNQIYIYHVHFSKDNEDTLFSIYRAYSKIENGLYEGHKIYQNWKMKPVVLNDFFKVSGEMTDEAVKNQRYSFWDVSTDEDEQHTTPYWYKVKNNKIHFWKKDSTFVDRMNKLNVQ